MRMQLLMPIERSMDKTSSRRASLQTRRPLLESTTLGRSDSIGAGSGSPLPAQSPQSRTVEAENRTLNRHRLCEHFGSVIRIAYEEKMVMRPLTAFRAFRPAIGSNLRKVPGFALAGLLALSAGFAADTPWPQFRGPDANPVGADTHLPDRWSTSENVEWSVEIPGRGWSSPIVTGGRVFLTTATTNGASKKPQIGTDYSNEYVAELMKQGLSEADVLKKVTERDIELPAEVTLHYFLYCLDIGNGGVLWRKEFFAGHPPGGRHRKNSFTSETPVTDGERVYVYVGNLGLYAYDLDGEQVWAAPLESHPIYLDFGTGSSPVLAGDQLLILNDNEEQQFLAAFDKKTGKQLWRVNRDIGSSGGESRKSGWATPFIWTNPQRTEIVTSGPGIAVSYDLHGKELWRLSGMSINPAPSPFAHDGLLYLDGGQTRPLFAIRPGASGDISPADGEKSSEYVTWAAERAGTYIPTPLAYKDSIYVLYDKGIFARFNAKTGQLAYKARIDPEAGAFTSSPWAYNDKVFCLSELGDTYVLSAGETFEVQQVNPLGEMALATPAIVGERLLIRTASRLYSIRQKSE
jgi:outer membrane protein assembly factor BamB